MDKHRDERWDSRRRDTGPSPARLYMGRALGQVGRVGPRDRMVLERAPWGLSWAVERTLVDNYISGFVWMDQELKNTGCIIGTVFMMLLCSCFPQKIKQHGLEVRP